MRKPIVNRDYARTLRGHTDATKVIYLGNHRFKLEKGSSYIIRQSTQAYNTLCDRLNSEPERK